MLAWLETPVPGGIEPACTDAPDGAPPNGECKDALDTVAHRRNAPLARQGGSID